MHRTKECFYGEVPFLEFAVESNGGRKRFPSHQQIFCSRASRANEVNFLHLLWTSPRGSKATSGVSNISNLDFSSPLKLVDIFHVVWTFLFAKPPKIGNGENIYKGTSTCGLSALNLILSETKWSWLFDQARPLSPDQPDIATRWRPL